jgi:hypothetical protein
MARRTQIYLTDAQRARLDGVAERLSIPMAEVGRSIDACHDMDDDLDAASVPGRDGWCRG